MKDDKKRFSKLVWLLILPLELTPKTAREKRWADFPDNFFGLILRKSDYLSCFGLWMRFFQQSQAKVHGQKPLPCTKTNKTYLAKHPSTYFFIGSQMVGFHGTSTFIQKVIFEQIFHFWIFLQNFNCHTSQTSIPNFCIGFWNDIGNKNLRKTIFDFYQFPVKIILVGLCLKA